jgi:hypothetical protein
MKCSRCGAKKFRTIECGDDSYDSISFELKQCVKCRLYYDEDKNKWYEDYDGNGGVMNFKQTQTKHLQIITPFQFQWLKGYREAFNDWRVTVSDRPHPETNPDVMMFMWADPPTRHFIKTQKKKCKYVVFVRRYELFSYDLTSFPWDKVDETVMVNDVLAKHFEETTGKQPHVVYNGVTPKDWTFKKRKHGKNIAWVGFVNLKKNLQLAIQIMDRLPRDYHLHIAGEIQDTSVMLFLREMAIKRDISKITFYGHVRKMNAWLEDKNYLLSTAISEGCPNNVIEAMAKGIKPVVYGWPGAECQFGENVFTTVEQAVRMLHKTSEYKSKEYRKTVENTFGRYNFEKVKELVEAI